MQALGDNLGQTKQHGEREDNVAQTLEAGKGKDAAVLEEEGGLQSGYGGEISHDDGKGYLGCGYMRCLGYGPDVATKSEASV